MSLLLRHREGADGCRKLFHKAVNSVTDDPQRVCEAYLQFEREEGSLEHFEAALCRTASQTERLRERREKVGVGCLVKGQQGVALGKGSPRERITCTCAPKDLLEDLSNTT